MMTVIGIVIFFVGILLSVAWHELGHFTAAKAVGTIVGAPGSHIARAGCGWSGVRVMQSWWAPPFHSAVKPTGQRISQPVVLAMVSGRQR